LPSGRLFYCHDTEDPFLFDPSINDTVSVSGDIITQGCVGPTLLYDGRLIFLGGTDQQVYGPGIRKVKTYNPFSDSWNPEPDLLENRWYPSIAQLPNGRLLVIGGGGLDNPTRVNSSEIYNPYTLNVESVDSIQIGNEVSPLVLLYTGEVLMTHRPPQLFDSQTKQWRLAADFVQGNRMPNGDHSDHELVLLPENDGRVVAIGNISFTGNPGNMVEIYDPVNNVWSLGSNFSPVRSRAKTVLLPNKMILVAGGFKEETTDPAHTNQWGQLFLTDLYDPYTDSWRRLDNLNYAREYHCTTILVPDGRIIAVGGEGKPGNEPSLSILEAYQPSYLFRGPRPEISNLSSLQLARGERFTFDFHNAVSLTSVVLISTAAVTHFMNSGNNRYLELDFNQNRQQVNARIPSDSVKVPYGYYMLFAMVDDIPSAAQIIQVNRPANTTPTDPEIHERIHDFVIFPNPAANEIQLSFRHISSLSAPIRISLTDARGKLLQEEMINPNQGRAGIRFSLSGLADGIYFISVNMNGWATTRKILLNR